MKGIVLKEDLDLKVVNGRLSIGDITYQNQKILILGDKGEFKDAPMRGVGAQRYLEDSSPDALAREIRTEFTIDGMKVDAIKIGASGKIEIDAYYGTN